MLVLLWSMVSGAALAQTNQRTQSFTLQPAGKATLTYEAYCTDFGLKFPTTLQAPNAVADDKLRGGLAYIQQNNLSADQNQALEAQYGIWQLRGATASPSGGDTTKGGRQCGKHPAAEPAGNLGAGRHQGRAGQAHTGKLGADRQ
jgi:hypothetical protein